MGPLLTATNDRFYGDLFVKLFDDDIQKAAAGEYSQTLQCGCSARSIADFGFDGQLLAAMTGSSRLTPDIRGGR
jgi:hypothetical protein